MEISDYVHRNHTINDCKPGHKPVFSAMVEAEMVKAETDAAQMGLVCPDISLWLKLGMLHTKWALKLHGKQHLVKSGCMAYENVMMS